MVGEYRSSPPLCAPFRCRAGIFIATLLHQFEVVGSARWSCRFRVCDVPNSWGCPADSCLGPLRSLLLAHTCRYLISLLIREDDGQISMNITCTSYGDCQRNLLALHPCSLLLTARAQYRKIHDDRHQNLYILPLKANTSPVVLDCIFLRIRPLSSWSRCR